MWKTHLFLNIMIHILSSISKLYIKKLYVSLTCYNDANKTLKKQRLQMMSKLVEIRRSAKSTGGGF